MAGTSWRRALLPALGKLTLLAVGLCAGLLIAEIGVRLLAPQALWQWHPGPFVEDGAGFFRLRPGLHSVSKNRVEFEHQVQVNAAGLRGPELEVKEAAECRILAIGDSFTFGVGVEGAEVFHQQAAQLLRQRGVMATALNGGIPAIGVPQAVRWLRRHGLKTEPDVVLLSFFVGNDLQDASSLNEWVIDGGQLVIGARTQGWKRWLYLHSHLYVLLKKSLAASLLARLGLREPWSLRSARDSFAVYQLASSPLIEEGLRNTDLALGELVQLAEAHDFRLVATLIPDILQVDDQRWQAALRQLELVPEDYHPRRPNTVLQELFASHQIPLLDLTDVFDAGFDAGEELYFPIDRHWTAAGHRLAAVEIVDQLFAADDACRPAASAAEALSRARRRTTPRPP